MSAQTDSVDAKIERLLTLSGTEAQFTGAIDQMIAIQRQNPAFDNEMGNEFWTEFSAEIKKSGYADILPKIMKVYRDNYTEAEIDHQIAYFSDPLTQKLVAKQPTVMQQSMQAGAEWGQTMGMKIATMLQQAKEKN